MSLKILVILSAISSVLASVCDAGVIEHDEVSLLQKTATVELSSKRNEGADKRKEKMSPEEEGFEEALREYHEAKRKAAYAKELRDRELAREAQAKAEAVVTAQTKVRTREGTNSPITTLSKGAKDQEVIVPPEPIAPLPRAPASIPRVPAIIPIPPSAISPSRIHGGLRHRLHTGHHIPHGHYGNFDDDVILHRGHFDDDVVLTAEKAALESESHAEKNYLRRRAEAERAWALHQRDENEREWDIAQDDAARWIQHDAKQKAVYENVYSREFEDLEGGYRRESDDVFPVMLPHPSQHHHMYPPPPVFAGYPPYAAYPAYPAYPVYPRAPYPYL